MSPPTRRGEAEMNGNFETSLNLSWAIVAILMIVVVPLGVFLLLEIRRVRAEVREMKKPGPAQESPDEPDPG